MGIFAEPGSLFFPLVPRAASEMPSLARQRGGGRSPFDFASGHWKKNAAKICCGHDLALLAVQDQLPITSPDLNDTHG